MRITAELIRSAIADCGDLAPFASPIDLSAARPAAVVLPITLASDRDASNEATTPSLLVVLRGAHLKDHGGEVGFPGGKPEATDEDLRATALRETSEEVGLAAGDVELLGRLTPCPVITGRYVIHPFVGVVRPGAVARVVSTEVARILYLPILPFVRGERRIGSTSGEWRGQLVTAPHFELDGCTLYGASAYIAYELLARIATALGVLLPPLVPQPLPPWGGRYEPG